MITDDSRTQPTLHRLGGSGLPVSDPDHERMLTENASIVTG